jgi:D-alanine--poly(phosphoribitol) ligase subunit 2
MITQIQHEPAPRYDGIEIKVQRIFREGLELDVDVDTDVIEEGLLDSLAFVQLLLALEEEFGVKVDLADIELDDFSTVTRIARLVSMNGEASS